MNCTHTVGLIAELVEHKTVFALKEIGLPAVKPAAAVRGTQRKYLLFYISCRPKIPAKG
jgi:hypothetical protein